MRFENQNDLLAVVGSTMRSDGTARTFRIDVPDLACDFVGTGDMFAALMVVRLREACATANMTGVASWVSPDDVKARELPLAKAVEKALASMQLVLEKTQFAMEEEMERVKKRGEEGSGLSENEMHLRRTKASEVRLIRNMTDLKDPVIVYRAQDLVDSYTTEE